jgi:hypothetical protein
MHRPLPERRRQREPIKSAKLRLPDYVRKYYFFFLSRVLFYTFTITYGP